MKVVAKKIGKIFLWIFTSIIVLIFLICTLFMIPAVQTFVAQKAAGFLSEKMQTEVSIGKLRIDFNLDICLEDIRLNDQRGNNLISAKKGSLSFPSFNTGTANVEISNIILEEADVTFRRYESDTVLNLQFFVDFVRRKDKRTTIVDLRNVQLKNSRFHLRNDNTAGKDTIGKWNYSNMIIEDINIKCRQIFIVGDSLNFSIDKLSARERSGFEVENLTGFLIVARSGLQCLDAEISTKNASKLNLDFRFEYSDYKDYHDFIHKVVFNTDLHKGRFNLADLQYFAPSFKDMNEMVTVSATIKGTIVDFKIRNLALEYGKDTKIEGNIDLNGLPKIDETFIDFTVKNLKTNIIDLASFSLPNNKTIPIPDILKKVEWVQVQGHFLGLYDNFFADADFSTGIGAFACELMFNNRSKPISYDGKLETNGLALGRILNTEDIGNISLAGHIKGEGVTIDDLNFQLQSTISSVTYRDNTVENIEVSGNFLSKQFDGQILCDDEDFDLDFVGLIDFNPEDPIYDFEANIRSVNLSNFRLFRPDSNVKASAFVKMNLIGKNIEHMYGEVAMKNIVYSENNIDYSFPDFSLEIKQDEYPFKTIALTSDVLSVDMSGKFTYLQAFKAAQNNLHLQLSNLVPAPIIADTSQKKFPQQFNLSLNLKKTIPLLEHFIPVIDVEKGITALVSIDQSKNTGQISIEVPQLDIKNKQRLTNIVIRNQQTPRMFNLGVTCDAFYSRLTDTIPDIQEFDLQAAVEDNTIDFLATAAGNSKNKLHDVLLEGSVKFLDMKKREMEITLNNGSIHWDEEIFLLDASNFVYLAKDSIFVHNFGLQSNSGKSITAKSGTTERGDDAILFSFDEINLGLFNVFLNQYKVNLEGVGTGKGGLVRNTYGYALGSDFQVNDFEFNNVAMGFLQGRTFWDNKNRKLFIQASLYEEQQDLNTALLNVRGSFDPKNKYIDLTGNVDSLNIKFLEPYLRSFASKVGGFGTGEITFKGPVATAKLEGNVKLKNGILGVDFLKTDYFIKEGNIRFVDTGFIFENIAFHDQFTGTGTVSGVITHKRLRDFGLNLRINANNLSVLNTTLKDNNLFYGKAFATGNAAIYGKVSDILMIEADVTTNPFTDITLSMDWSTTATKSNFITFVTPDNQKNIGKDSLKATEIKKSSMALNLRVTATPDATARVVFDPMIGGDLVVRGNGTVELILDENNDFFLYGPYTITGGDFNLAWGDFLTRTFKLQNGGIISWTGDPMEGMLNAQAVLNGKVSVSNLFEEESTVSRRHINVNNILTLSGRLLSPDFYFTFGLPDADETTRTRVYDAIDTTNREEMVRQMVNILLLGKFEIQTENSGGNMVNSGLTHSLSELVSYHVSRFVSNLAPNIDVRGSYRQGEDASENEYSVDVEGSFLNDKLTISTNLGIIEKKDLEGQNQILGDVTVEYKLTKDGSLRIKAFNVTNQQDILQASYSTSSKYSQGIGLSYSKDFDKVKDLFSKEARKERKERRQERKEERQERKKQPTRPPEEKSTSEQ